jgi:hypothetical protein
VKHIFPLKSRSVLDLGERGRPFWNRFFFLACVVGTALVTSGCASQGSEVDSAPATFNDVLRNAEADGSQSQVHALKDKRVTSSELNEAINKYFDCLTKEGLTYKLNGTNPVDGWRPLIDVNWSGLTDADGMAKDSACRRKNLEYVEYGFEMLNQDVMEPKLMAGVQECLVKLRVEISGQERNVRDLLPLGGQDEKRANAVQSCIYSVGSTYSGGLIFVY